jgi:hypothetical protein
MLRLVVVFFSLLALGCGGATASTTTAASAVNIADSEWARAEVPEGGISIEMPGRAVRRVSTRDDGQTFEYVVAREPLAFIAAIEHFEAVVLPESEPASLDAVAALFASRAIDAQRQCTNGAIANVTVGGHAGRMLVSTDCASFSGGSMATAAFIHGASLISLVIVGAGVPGESTRALMQRMIESIEFGEPRSWFMPVNTPMTFVNVPGLTLMMPEGATSDVVEMEGHITARYTAEPIRGSALVVVATTPATLAVGQYCSALESVASLELPTRQDHLQETIPFCQVRARRVANPAVLEIHDVMIVGGAVLELTWVGPYLPSFVAGGEAQLEAIRASIQAP